MSKIVLMKKHKKCLFLKTKIAGKIYIPGIKK